MNLKRHHVLYILLTLSLMLALLIILVPRAPEMSDSTISQASSMNTALVDASTNVEPVSAMRFEVVTTPAAEKQGLGGRTDVPKNYGMLFVFPQNTKVGFWMKDMRVSLDIVWLSDTGVILGIEDSLSPNSYPKIVYPPSPVKYVLETKAGEMKRRGWSVGTKIELPAPYGK